MSTQFSTISPQQLHEAKRRGQFAPVLDVRSVAEYRAGHIPGAQLIPIDSLSADALAEVFKRPSLGREETLYISCHTGPRALQAAELLQQAGINNVTLIEGGTQRWEQLGLTNEAQEPGEAKESYDSSWRATAMLDYSPSSKSLIRLQLANGDYETEDGTENVWEAYVQLVMTLGEHRHRDGHICSGNH